MDKSALVNQTSRFLDYLRSENIQVDFAALIPEHTLFRHDSYALVISSSSLANTPGRTRTIVDSWFAFTTLDERKSAAIMTFRVFVTVDEAMHHISEQDVTEFVIPIIEPVHV
ncbi:hypothetical protein [Spirosoma rhododendri]|uniref:Uncharacterized protein n=1 Tax=Spirosoma rhododendri TaxID=2728024 RepID=A0A7L5DMV9_9BACT|nr:hypothetical protein [Spirosoma rhododendri]QJD78553.1 hypothetical protein HH216_09045 [Spirosoma rhododendri]